MSVAEVLAWKREQDGGPLRGILSRCAAVDPPAARRPVSAQLLPPPCPATLFVFVLHTLK